MAQCAQSNLLVCCVSIMRPAMLMSLLIPCLLAAAAEVQQDTDLPVDALAADEECAAAGDAGAPACALSALQRQAQKAATGGEEVAAEASTANTTVGQEGELDDAGEPEAFVELEDTENEEGESESAEGHDSSLGDSFGRRRSSSRSKNKCCKCNDNKVSWSASGTCTHCQHSGIFKALAPPAKCQQGSSQWRGKNSRTGRGDPSWPKYCAKQCVQLLASYRPPSGGSGYHPGGGSGYHPGGGSGYHPGTSPGSCKTETGGSCKFFGCAKSRGRGVKCVKKKCICQAGTCANSKGQCV